MSGNSTIRDVVIIGGGPAGLTAALYLKRLGLDPLVIERSLPGGKLNEVPIIENYPGVEPVKGLELASRFLKQVQDLGVEIWYPEEVVDVSNVGGFWCVKTSGGKCVLAYALIIATGAERVRGTIRGEFEFLGRGISYCAVCDGPLYRGKVVAVVGCGEKAIKEAQYLTTIASKVYLVLEKVDEVTEAYLRRLGHVPNLEVIEGRVEEVRGRDRVEKIVVRPIDGSIKEIDVSGVFIARAEVPNTAIFRKIGINVDDRGFIIVDRSQRTNIEGVFAAGDVTGRGFQVVVACGDGAVAALSAYRYVIARRREVVRRDNVFELRVNDKVAYLRYRVEGRKLIIESVYVPEEFRGLGIGKRLVLEAAKYALSTGLSIQCECDYAKYIVEKYLRVSSD
ncbi:MAG: thioredoxin reductase [Thermoprotei archaeon]|nr:MAG: thioredoxin reductase [Thermoprotei archaeon]